MKKLSLLFSSALVFNFINAQKVTIPNQQNDQPVNWVDLKTSPNANFYDVQRAFNAYWADKDINVPGNGYKPFKRWEYWVEPRVFPSGDLSLLSKNNEYFQEFLNKEANSSNQSNKFSSPNMIASTTWTAIGPMGAMTGSATNGLPRKAGRDNFITFHPTVANTFWVGSPAGGLWKTTDNGATWTTTTNSLTVIGCTDMAIDPSNPSIMYLATGDGYAGDTPSIGVLKSTDGGATWATTGLTQAVSSNFLIRRLIINPTNPQILMAATNGGIYRTTNAGTNWTQVSTINCYDMEFKPSDANTVYAGSNTAFYLSTNGGTSFTVITNGITNTGANRLAIAVTPADANYVYVLRSNTSSGFGGMYRSTTSGTSFSVMSTTPDVLANSCAGTSGGGQGWYDLAVAASPLNKDIVVVGGVNHWRSTNGGAAWTNIGCWNSTVANPPYVHADVHDLEYTSTGTLYSTNDGGVYFHTGTSWTDITANRNIAQIYRIGTSALTANRWMTGHQDNGSNLYTGAAYLARYPGDGMDCFIDRTNDNNLFASTPSGGHVKSTDGGVNWSAANGGISQGGNWVTPWKQDPAVATRIYSGRTALWVSNNSGGTYTQVPATGGTGAIVEFAIAPSNNQVIYVLHSGSIRKTINGGATWTAITGTVPVGSGAPQYVSVKSNDPNTAWVVLSGYSAGNKVFKTTDGGATWSNISTNLPNLPANCVVYEGGANDRIYVGMDVGVYYKDNITTNWTLYNAGLPNVPISELDISPAAPTKLRASTYGRGVWEVDLVPSNVPPVSSYTTSNGSICTGVPKVFSDGSSNAPTSWSWSVSPSTGVTINTSASQNPTITFANPGTYSVSLQAGNGFGPGNVITNTVTVLATPTVVVANTSQTVCSGNSATLSASGATTYSWNTSATTASIVVTPASTTVYTVTGFNGTCNNVKTASVSVNPSPTVSVNSPSICGSGSVVLTASGASTYSWNTTATTASILVSPTLTTVYTVTGTTGSCKNVKTSTVTVNTTPTVAVNASTICSGNPANLTASGATSYSWSTGATTSSIAPSPMSTTVYTVIGFNGACNSSKTTTVTVNASPTVAAATTNTIICQGELVVLSATGANSYTWQPGAVTSSSMNAFPSSTQVYTVTGSNANGCTGTAFITINVSTCAGITNVNGDQVSFVVFPNPAKEKITLQVQTNKTISIPVEMVDVNGKLIFKQNLNYSKDKNENQIDISTMPNGVYFLKIYAQDNKVQTVKFVKE
jgi:photosystem II stability/assembly factor-like uncharacterized protein